MSTPSAVGNEVAATMTRVTRVLGSAIKEALTDAGKVAKAEVEAQGRRRTGGNLKFSNMGGARIGVRLKQTSDAVFVNTRGPWGMLEPGANPHRITSRHPMRVGGELRRGPFNHPGTPNTRAWSMGRDETFDKLGHKVPEQIGNEVEESFGG